MSSPRAVAQALAEAFRKFGKATPRTRERIAQWVQQRAQAIDQELEQAKAGTIKKVEEVNG